MPEHVLIFAVVVNADSREEAMEYAYDRMPDPRTESDAAPYIDSWWHADDDRRDRSDCDSAVFVKPGHQVLAGYALDGLPVIHDIWPGWFDLHPPVVHPAWNANGTRAR